MPKIARSMSPFALLAAVAELEDWTPPAGVLHDVRIQSHEGQRRLWVTLYVDEPEDGVLFEVKTPPGPEGLAALDAAAEEILEAAWDATVKLGPAPVGRRRLRIFNGRAAS